MPYLSASAVVIHYEEALYQVYAPLPLSSGKNFVGSFALAESCALMSSFLVRYVAATAIFLSSMQCHWPWPLQVGLDLKFDLDFVPYVLDLDSFRLVNNAG